MLISAASAEAAAVSHENPNSRLFCVTAALLTFCTQATAQLAPLTYHHVGMDVPVRETLERTFAACKVQADVASPMIEGSWQSLAYWQLARDDCMRAHGWVRD